MKPINCSQRKVGFLKSTRPRLEKGGFLQSRSRLGKGGLLKSTGPRLGRVGSCLLMGSLARHINVKTPLTTFITLLPRTCSHELP